MGSIGGFGGSFGPSKESLEAKYKDIKANEAVAKVTQEEEKKADANIAPTPEFVESRVFGKVTYEVFKKQYKTIWDQVYDKDHLFTQRIQYTTQLAGASITLQSLIRKEQTAILLFDSMFLSADPGPKAKDERRDIGAYKTILHLVRLGNTQFPKVTLTPDTRLEWAADPAIRQQYDYVLDLDPIYVGHILGIVDDMDQAKQLALMENAGNP